MDQVSANLSKQDPGHPGTVTVVLASPAIECIGAPVPGFVVLTALAFVTTIDDTATLAEELSCRRHPICRV
ncbi:MULTISPECIES: hypothetical protein [unclassified Bradyrhizobium]|uniref:hypothetical protein n=1 Tax=unclassified Bradyrhizobium TaxID=2631580 RepID=UPI002FEF9369